MGCQPNESVNQQPHIAQQAPLLSAQNHDWQLAYDEFKLPNGIHVVLIQNRHAPIVSVGSYFYAGYRHESEQFAGYAKFLPHVTDHHVKNTYQQTAKSIIASLGGQIRSSVRGDLVSYTLSLPSSQLELALDVIAQRQQPLSLANTELEKLKSSYISQIKEDYLAKPYAGFPWFSFPAQVYSQWPDSHNYYANVANLEKMTSENIAIYQAVSQQTRQQSIVVNGDIDLVATKSLIERSFSSFKAKETPKQQWPSEIFGDGSRYQLYDSKISAPALSVSYVMPSIDASDFWSAMLLQHYLSRHFDDYEQLLTREISVQDIQLLPESELVVERLLAESRQLMPISFVHPKEVAASLLEEKAHNVLISLFNTIDETILEREKLALKKSIFSMMDSTYGSFTNQLMARFSLIEGDTELINTFEQAISDITLEQINQAQATYLSSKKRHALMLNKEKANE